MKNSTVSHRVTLIFEFSVATTRRGCDNVPVEGKWNKNNDRQKIDDGAYSAHSLGTVSGLLEE